MTDILKPVVSVIIPMQNAEKFVGECLDSLLMQTLQNFEVIVIGDDSANNSAAIIESYAPKFNGRLTLASSRNQGLSISRGEYVQFLNAGDMLIKTALTELYALAKKYDADVVYCENFYEVNPDDTNIQLNVKQGSDSTEEPTFEPEDLQERVQKIIDDKYSLVAWDKFVKRNLLANNEIVADDYVWSCGLILCAKKFLRVSNAVYIHRASTVQTTPQQTINSSLKPVLFGLKTLDDLMSKHEFFYDNPDCRFALLKKFIDNRLNHGLNSARRIADDIIYSAIKDEFGEKLGDYDVLIPALFAAIYSKKISKSFIPTYDEKKPRETDAEILSKFSQYFTARLDIQMITANKNDFKILSISDDKAEIQNPDWLNRNGVGYVIQSYAGNLNIVFKAIKNGLIILSLKGLLCVDSNDKSKRIPYWVDYTKLIVNDKIIFDKLTPAWHDKPCNYRIEAKADEEITISVEWLPHRSNT